MGQSVVSGRGLLTDLTPLARLRIGQNSAFEATFDLNAATGITYMDSL